MASTASTEGARGLDPDPIPRSHVPGAVWPALVRDAGARLLALQYQLMHSQWWTPDVLLAQQRRQLAALVAHANGTVPYYRGVLPRGLIRADGTIDWDRWLEVPILTRAQVQRAGTELLSGFLPRDHAPVNSIKTSGSTGRPVQVAVTVMTQLFWHAFTLREHLWNRRDFGAKLAVIRNPRETVVPAGGLRRQGWGPSTDAAYETGPFAFQSITIDIAQQADWLVREDPVYLLTYPSNLLALAEHCERRGLRLPRLREVRTISEMLTPEVRAAARRVWNVPVVDAYSTNETGWIAAQCPEHEHYHVQAEGVLVEILADDGRPCRPGETGRVILTPLHNFATVLLRYEVGDYAQAGGPCPCGRGLPVIDRILGRYRNLVRLPDGRRYWPQVGQAQLRDLAPVGQFQLVQTSLETVEMRYVADREFSAAERDALTALLAGAIGHPFRILFERVPSIARSASGKYEDFICQVPEHAA